MELSKTGFWATVYHASRRIWLTFLHKPDWYVNPYHDFDRTDLCTFVRTVFVWAPITLAINLAVVGQALFSIAFLVKALFPHMLDIGFGVLIVGGFFALFGLIYPLGYGIGHLVSITAKSETTRLAVGYLKARKSRICPIISFERTPNANA